MKKKLIFFNLIKKNYLKIGREKLAVVACGGTEAMFSFIFQVSWAKDSTPMMSTVRTQSWRMPWNPVEYPGKN